MKKQPPEIRILPENVANKIAAGEVIERPAAVVKELLENSIDAGATRLDIEFKSGGKSFVKLIDNGCGMTREQVLMSLEPHATSKIRQPEDLFKISSYGFRGEAVPSIASVSKFCVRSRPELSETGTQVDVYAGEVKSVKECGMPSGTETIVENLFCSVPARRKFLKSDNVEASHITKLCRLYALALPQLAITLIENARVVFRSAQNLPVLERIERIFGAEISSKLMELETSAGSGISVSGAILKPAESFATSRNICAFINSRPVECRAIYSAIKEAYAQYMPKGRYAAAFLFIDIDPASVDVNVHPAKREVRLKNEFGVRDFLLGSIAKKLSSYTLSTTAESFRLDESEPEPPIDSVVADAAKKLSQTRPDAFARPQTSAHSQKFASHLHGASANSATCAESAPLGASGGVTPPANPALIPAISPRATPTQSSKVDANGFSGDSENVKKDDLLSSNDNIKQADLVGAQVGFSPKAQPATSAAREFERSAVANFSGKCDSCDRGNSWRYVGCIRRKYAIFESSKSMVLMSVSSALKRVHYERIMRSLRGERAVSQRLLMPISMKFDRADGEFFEVNRDTFNACGFEIEEFGKNFYRIYSAPDWLPFSDLENFVRDFVEMSRDESRSLKNKRLADEAFASLIASKINMTGFVCLEASAQSLLDELLRCASHMTSPDGKPTLKELSDAEIARMFGMR